MIVSDTYRFVLISPPKTASTSLHRFLSQKPFRATKYKPSVELNQHDTDIPERCRDYHIVTCWRDPLDRNISLWRHSQSAWELKHGIPKLSFEEFIREYQETSKRTFFREGQAYYYKRMPKWAKFTKIFQFTKLNLEIKKFQPIMQAWKDGYSLTELGRSNRTYHGTVEEHYTEELKKIVIERFRDDYNFHLYLRTGK